MADTRKEGFVDRWIVYGKVDGEQLFTAKELTVEPGAKCTINDNGAYGLITVQGKGKMNGLSLDCPKLIRFHELTEDEEFCTERAAREGVAFENTTDVEPLVMLRYFGPGVNPGCPGRWRLQEEQILTCGLGERRSNDAVHASPIPKFEQPAAR